MKKLLGLVVALLVLTLASCGGGGGGGSSGPAQPTTVSGLVLAPGGQIAFDRQPAPLTRLAEALLPNAAAGVTGLVPVADGTAVELVRIDANGSVVASLAQTTTSAGRYSLDLSALNAGYAPDLIVRVRNANGGAQMRAFVAGGTSDLNPVSEAAVRIALEEIAKQPSVSLANFSPQELGDIAGTIDLLATHKKLAAGADVEASVQAIRAMVLADSAAQSYIRDAAGVGVSTSGPGDIGNYFRSEPNLSYTYNVNANFGQIRQYQTFRQTSGPRVAGGNVMVFTEAGGEDYYTEDASGVTFFGGSDALDGAVAPFVELKFPLRVGNSFLQIDKKNLLLDVDFDGRDDSVDIRSEASVLDFEPLSVPIGSQSNCAKIQEDVTVTYRTSNNGKVNVVGKNTYWLCPGIGLTKQIIELTENGGGTRRETRELTAFVDSNVPPNPNPQPNPNPNPQPNPTPAVTTRSITLASNDLVFDPFSQRLLASIPGRVGGNGNSIAFIEPLAGVVEQTIAIGSEPTKLALSDNGQYLYTALDGAGAVRRLDLTTKTAGAQFSLDINAPFGQLYARDIAVMPGNPKTIAISLFAKNFGVGQGVAIYDDGVKRPTVTPGFGSDFIEFSNVPTTIFSADSGGLREIKVDATGASETRVITSGDSFTSDILFAGGRIYTLSGRVIDAASGTLLQSYVLPTNNTFGGSGFPRAMLPDSRTNRAYFLVESFPNSEMQLHVFNLQTATYVGAWRVPLGTNNNSSFIATASSFVAWGADQLAFRASDDRIYLLEAPK